MNKIVWGFLLLISNNIFAADWASDWLDDSLLISGPSYHQGASRNYLSAGNLSFRRDTSVVKPISIAAPRVKAAGCGGIDLFMGGISYMDVDMLIDKFEQMIQNGDVIAFQLAIKSLSEKLGTTVESIESIINKINGVQFDSCAMSKTAVTTVFNGGGAVDAMGAVWEEISQEQELGAGSWKNAWDRGQDKANNNNQPSSTTNIADEVNACPAHIKDIILLEGSVLEVLAADYGLSAYTNDIRGYMGDMFITHTAAGGLPNAQKIMPCRENDQASPDNLVYGDAFAMPPPTISNLTPVCAQNANTLNLLTITEDHIDNLITSLLDPSQPPSSFSGLEQWLSRSPLPVQGIVKTAVDQGVQDDVKSEIVSLLAYAYAYEMFDDLYKSSSKMFKQIQQALSSTSFDASQAGPATRQRCNLRPYLHIVKFYEDFAQNIQQQHSDLREAFDLALTRHTSKIVSISKYQDDTREERHTNMGVHQ